MRWILAAALAGGGLATSGPAIARDRAAPVASLPAPEAEPAEAQIVVTATKRPGGETVADVPAAITAFDARALAGRQARDLQSLSYAVPGVSLDPVGTFRGVANFAIRGLGINSSIPSIDAAVGTVVDGVYVAANAGVVFDQFDLASVEIVRGPQGVLFGRNTTGGAVLVNTADPTFAWEGHARVRAEGPVDRGRGAMRGTGQFVLSGPVTDAVAVRLGVYRDSDGGYFRNGLTGGSFGAAETTLLRAGIKALVTPRLTVVAKAEMERVTGDGAPGQNHGIFARDGFAIALDNPGFIRARNRFATVRADWELGPGTLTDIAGWRRYTNRTSNDIDSSPRFLFHSNTALDQEQWSNELRWAGTLGRLDVTAGAFLFWQDIAYEEDRALPTVSALRSYGGGRQDHAVQGLFAQGDYRLTPALTLTAGLRWSHERKAAAITYVRARPACSVVAGTCPVDGTNPLIVGEANGIRDAHDWSSLSPKLTASYRLSAAVLAYAGWTRGVRSGGYNLRVTQPAAFQEIAARQGTAAFGEERVDAYEAGLKLTAADGRAHLNLAVYRNDVAGIQREISVPSPTSGLAQYIYNTADARIHGGEAEASFAATSRLRVSVNAGLISARYTRVFLDLDGDGRVTGADRDLKLPRAPRWTWGGEATYRLPLAGEASLAARGAFQHRSRYAYTDNNWGYNRASDMLEASLALDLGRPAITLTLYGRNLLDAVQFGGDTQIPFGGALSDGNNRPFDPRPGAGTFSPLFAGRVVGLQATLDF